MNGAIHKNGYTVVKIIWDIPNKQVTPSIVETDAAISAHDPVRNIQTGIKAGKILGEILDALNH